MTTSNSPLTLRSTGLALALVIGVPAARAVNVPCEVAQKLTASDAQPSDLFGVSVSVSGDTAIVGAWLDDDGADNAGSAYVFVRSGATWVQQWKLLHPTPTADAFFGRSVSISGDTAIVGAFKDDAVAGMDEDQGAAHVFVRSKVDSTWSLQATLTADDRAPLDFFGYSVSISGDVAVVGAYQNDGGGGMGANRGAAYVFVRTGSAWSDPPEKLTAPDGADSDEFGRSVSASGNTILVGAYLHAHPGGITGTDDQKGAAYVFIRDGSAWPWQATLTAPDATAYDRFGSAVSVAGDLALVGAPGDDNAGGLEAGSAYAFARSGSLWDEGDKMTAVGTGQFASFGISVSVSGQTALVGAHASDHSGELNAGSAHVFGRSGSDWDERMRLTAFDPGTNDFFGIAASLWNGTAFIGAMVDDHFGGADAGSAYVFDVADADGDGLGDACDPCDTSADQDGDALPDSLEAACPCDSFNNHGAFLKCVRGWLDQVEAGGCLSPARRHELQKTAARAPCP